MSAPAAAPQGLSVLEIPRPNDQMDKLFKAIFGQECPVLDYPNMVGIVSSIEDDNILDLVVFPLSHVVTAHFTEPTHRFRLPVQTGQELGELLSTRDLMPNDWLENLATNIPQTVLLNDLLTLASDPRAVQTVLEVSELLEALFVGLQRPQTITNIAIRSGYLTYKSPMQRSHVSFMQKYAPSKADVRTLADLRRHDSLCMIDAVSAVEKAVEKDTRIQQKIATAWSALCTLWEHGVVFEGARLRPSNKTENELVFTIPNPSFPYERHDDVATIG